MSCEMDIRRIELYKQFRDLTSSLTAKHEWQVFGYYDSMNVERLELHEDRHPLECVYEDSQDVSFKSNSSLKRHVIYAIGLGDLEVYNNFWDQRNDHPLLLVSLLHFKHPMNTKQQGTPDQGVPDSTSQEGAVRPNGSLLAGIIENLKKCLTDKQLIFAIYSAFDCNDAIVCTLADALNKAMMDISEITKSEDATQEVFTICARKNNIYHEPSEGKSEDLKSLERLRNIWERNQPILDKVDVFMRDADHGKLISETSELKKAFNDQYYMQYKQSYLKKHQKAKHPFRRYIMPGQEDVLLTMEKVPLPLFEKMFNHSYSSENPKDLLEGFFLKRITRTVISTEIPLAQSKEENEKGENPSPDCASSSTRAFDLIDKLQKAFDQKDNKDKPIWLGALMELLVELSNIEISLTAYDIYAQAILAQETMIDTLCALIAQAKQGLNDDLKKKEAEFLLDEIYNPSSELSSNFKEYLNGWSQLSFHAMHAEWQLTQSSDINRLYLFPAKLCRLYGEFMKLSSTILNAGQDSHKECVFFITPNIRDIPHFLSIYRPVGQPHMLIHGEIPADSMFSPQVILPHLVHEAAHYSGTVFRQRKLRNKVYLKCLLAFLLSQILKEDLLGKMVVDPSSSEGSKYNGRKVPFNQLLVDSLAEKMYPEMIDITGESNKYDYGDNVKCKVEKEIDDLLNLQPSFINPIIVDSIGSIEEYAELTRSEQMLSIVQYYKGPNAEYNALSYQRQTNICCASNDLMTILREAFSDLCMVKILGLSLEEYLSIICHGIRYNGSNDETDDSWARHIRFVSVIHTVFCDNCKKVSDLLDEKLNEWKDPNQPGMDSSISVKHYHDIRAIAQSFRKQEEKYSSNRLVIYFREQIQIYLTEVVKKLDKELGYSSCLVEELKEVYHVMANGLRACDKAFDLEKLATVEKIMHLKKNDSGKTQMKTEVTNGSTTCSMAKQDFEYDLDGI